MWPALALPPNLCSPTELPAVRLCQLGGWKKNPKPSKRPKRKAKAPNRKPLKAKNRINLSPKPLNLRCRISFVLARREARNTQNPKTTILNPKPPKKILKTEKENPKPLLNYQEGVLQLPAAAALRLAKRPAPRELGSASWLFLDLFGSL